MRGRCAAQVDGERARGCRALRSGLETLRGLRLLTAVGFVAASELRRDGVAATFPPAVHLDA
jgi:hypothetical protein